MPEHIGSLALRKGGDAVVALGGGFYTLNFDTSTSTKLVDPDPGKPRIRLNDGQVDGRAGSSRATWITRNGSPCAVSSGSVSIYRHTARPRHRLLERPVLESRQPDLLFRPHLDAEGFVQSTYVYEGKLVRFAPDGTLDRTVGLPVENATSVIFGGPISTSPTSPRWHAS